MMIYTTTRKSKSQSIVCGFLFSNCPIAEVNWKAWGYKNMYSCLKTLLNTVDSQHFPVEIHTSNNKIYILNPEFIKTI